MVEYIPCYGGPAIPWGFLPATRLASRKILIVQNIKKLTGPALWLLCGLYCIQVQYRVIGVHPTGLTVARGVGRCPLPQNYFIFMLLYVSQMYRIL
jgi:hypothetical protein